MIVSFFHCCDEMPQQNQHKGGRARSGSQLIMVGTSWLQEQELAGHIPFPVRKQRVTNASTLSSLCLFSKDKLPCPGFGSAQVKFICLFRPGHQ